MLRLIRCGLVCSIIIMGTLLFMSGCTGEDNSVSKITLSTLTIVPSEVLPGQSVTIGINALNNGKKPADFTAGLKINQDSVETQQISLATGETRTLSFQYTPQTAGSYQVDLNGQSGSFKVLKPAAFSVNSLSFSSSETVVGDNLSAGFTVVNSGEVSGEYLAELKIDGQTVNSSTIVLDGGEVKTDNLSFSISTAGTHVVELADLKQYIKVFKSAELKASEIMVNLGSALVGETITVDITVENSGEVVGKQDIDLILNGKTYQTRTVSVAPGASENLKFYFPNLSPGAYNIGFLKSTASFNVNDLSVNDLSKYANYLFNISYPTDCIIDEWVYDCVKFNKIGVGYLSVKTIRPQKGETVNQFYDSALVELKEKYPDFKLISNQVKPDNKNYDCCEFDYTYTDKNEKIHGRGKFLGTALFFYEIEFELKGVSWDKYNAVFNQCLASFTATPMYIGEYSSSELGFSLNLPEGSVLVEVEEGGLGSFDLIVDGKVKGTLFFELVKSTLTTSKYFTEVWDEYASNIQAKRQISDFVFSDGSVGIKKSIIQDGAGATGMNVQLFCQVKYGRAVTILFFGDNGSIQSKSGTINQICSSLQISKPDLFPEIDRNNSVILPEGELKTLDPALVEGGPGGAAGAVFSGLVRFDTGLKIAPDLAESWTVSPDGLTYTFNIRKNATFHNGRPVTAGDVKYSWERACDPSLKSISARRFLSGIAGFNERMNGNATQISGLRVIDNYTLEVNITAPAAYFLFELAQPVAFVVDHEDMKRGFQWYEHPNGTGPFFLKFWDKDSLLVLERYDQFYMGPVKLKNLVFRIYGGNSMQIYQTGDIDIAPVSLSVLELMQDPSFYLKNEISAGFSYDVNYIGFNVCKEPFDDINIRQALALALDVPKLIEVSMNGQAERASGFIPPGIPGNNPDVQPLDMDLEKSRRLIAASSYLTPENVPPITVYSFSSVSPIEQAVIGMWQALGIKVNSQIIIDQDDYLNRLQNHEFQVFFTGWRADYLDPQDFLDNLFRSDSDDNLCSYHNPAVDASLAGAALETDPVAREQQYREIEKMILSDLPAVPLYWKTRTYTLVKPYIKGFGSYPIDVDSCRTLSVTPQ